MLLLAAFGGLSLLLAAVGLYGVVAYAVTQRTQEIGLRMAFGATSRDVIEMVLRQALLLAGCGLAAGIGMAFAFRQVLRSEIFGIQSVDLPLYAELALLLLGVALAAAYAPARRAAAVDPTQALRSE